MPWGLLGALHAPAETSAALRSLAAGAVVDNSQSCARHARQSGLRQHAQHTGTLVRALKARARLERALNTRATVQKVLCFWLHSACTKTYGFRAYTKSSCLEHHLLILLGLEDLEGGRERTRKGREMLYWGRWVG